MIKVLWVQTGGVESQTAKPSTGTHAKRQPTASGSRAIHFNRPTAVEAHYLALAELFGCEWWTADERLFKTVRHELPWVPWIGNYDPSPRSNT